MSGGISRRNFLRYSACGAAVAAASGAVPGVLTRTAQACSPLGRKLVVIYKDGGEDFLYNTLQPESSALAAVRQGLFRTGSETLSLPGVSGWTMHSGLTNLYNQFVAGNVCLATGVHYNRFSGSHEESRNQYLTASANRTMLGAQKGAFIKIAEANLSAFNTSSCAVSVAGSDRITEQGTLFRAVNSDRLANLGLNGELAQGGGAAANALFQALALASTGGDVQTAVQEAWLGVENDVRTFEAARSNPVNLGLNTSLGRQLSDIATVFRRLPKEKTCLAYCRFGGFDTHGNQAPSIDNSRNPEFDQAIGAFINALQDMYDSGELMMVAISEFSRTVKVNGNKGTDHGGATLAYIISPLTNGSRVLGTFNENDIETNSLRMQINIADVFWDIWEKLGFQNIAQAFPGHTHKPTGIFA